LHTFSVGFAPSTTKVKQAREIKQVAAADNILTDYCYIYFLNQIGRLLQYYEMVHVIFCCDTVCEGHFSGSERNINMRLCIILKKMFFPSDIG